MSLGTVTLMLITTTGFYPGPKYDTFEECEAVSSEITHFTTFCHYKEPLTLPEAMADQTMKSMVSNLIDSYKSLELKLNVKIMNMNLSQKQTYNINETEKENNQQRV